MKVIISGSGFAAVPTINLLINKGIKPIVIDIGNHLDKEKKIFFKKEGPYTSLQHRFIDDYMCIGGLSNLWTGVIDKYEEEDIKDWPIQKSDLEIYYNKLINNFNFTQLHKFYSLNENFLDYKIGRIEKLNDECIYRDKGLSVKYSTILSNIYKNTEEKNNYFQLLEPLNLSIYIKSLIQKSLIEYKKGKITEVHEKDGKVILKVLAPDNENKKYVCDYLFVGCGSPSTLKLMQRSLNNFGKELKLKNSKKFIFPVHFKQKYSFKESFFNIFPIFQINLNSSRFGTVYSQISNLNITALNHLFPGIKKYENKIFLLKFLKNFGYSYFSLNSNFGDEFTFDKKGRINFTEKKIDKESLKSSLEKIFENKFLNLVFKHIKFPFKRKTHNHFGCAFPMKRNKKEFYESDIYGRIGNFKKISIVDSSIFTTLPAKPPTLSIMANSLRIAEQVLKNNFFV